MKRIDELKASWNGQADKYNQWDNLGLDEIVHFAQQCSVVLERARCAELVARGRVACNWNEREGLAQFIREGRVVGPDGQVSERETK